MRSKRDQTGEIIIDHRNSPGLTPEFMRANNLDGPVVGAGQTFEGGLKNCSHCGADVILRPERVRPREWCWACDAYICDPCGLLRKLGAPHKPLAAVLDEVYTAIQRRF